MRLPTWPTFENGAQSERWEWLWRSADAMRSLIFPQTTPFAGLDANRRYSVDSGSTVTLPLSTEVKIGDAVTVLTEGSATIQANAGQTIKLSQAGGVSTAFGSGVIALAVPANDIATVDVTVAGISAGSTYAFSFNGTMADGLILKQYGYQAADTLRLTFENLTALPDTVTTTITVSASIPTVTQTSTVAGSAESTAGNQFIKLVYTAANTWTAEYYTGTWTLA